LKRILLVLALLAAASAARASGMALRWNSCEGASNRNFACDVSTGADVLVASFSPPAGVGTLTGVSVHARISAAEGAVPPWWQMSSRGGCRNSSLSASYSVGDETDCEDPWQGQAMGGIAAYDTDGQGVVFQVAVAVPSTVAQAVSSGRTYAAFKLFVNHQRSTGAAGCTGCSVPMCITLVDMTLGQPNTQGCNPVDNPGCVRDPIMLTDGIPGMGGASNVVTWQGGTPRCGAGAPKPSTWSDLKKRYR
jgi:hypothetical protein